MKIKKLNGLCVSLQKKFFKKIFWLSRFTSLDKVNFSFLSSIFGSHSRPSSPSYDPSLQSMNNLAARSSKRSGLVRKHSTGNVKSGLSIPDGDELRRKSFDSVQPNMNPLYGDFPPEEI